jgi:hypothetical protein
MKMLGLPLSRKKPPDPIKPEVQTYLIYFEYFGTLGGRGLSD